MTTPRIKLSKKFVCFDIEQSALETINNELTEADRTTVFWRAESLAGHLYKDYQLKWQDPAGTIGEWFLPTVDKNITVCWRFEGVEDGLPVFKIVSITWEFKEEDVTTEEEVVTNFSSVRRIVLIVLAVVAIITIVAEELGALGEAVTHLFEIMTAIVTSIMAWKE